MFDDSSYQDTLANMSARIIRWWRGPPGGYYRACRWPLRFLGWLNKGFAAPRCEVTLD